jgi:hypothetical protein
MSHLMHLSNYKLNGLLHGMISMLHLVQGVQLYKKNFWPLAQYNLYSQGIYLTISTPQHPFEGDLW